MIIRVNTTRSGTQTYLIGGHREGVDISLLRRTAIREAILGRVQQLRSRVTDNSRLRGGCGTWLHDRWIGDDASDPEVSKACVTLLIDQDIPLDVTGIGVRLNLRATFIAHRIDIAVHDTQ